MFIMKYFKVPHCFNSSERIHRPNVHELVSGQAEPAHSECLGICFARLKKQPIDKKVADLIQIHNSVNFILSQPYHM